MGGDAPSRIFGTIVIDNRGGGGGLIGANDVAHAPPDGYSILLGSTTTQVLTHRRDGEPALRSGEELFRRSRCSPSARPRS